MRYSSSTVLSRSICFILITLVATSCFASPTPEQEVDAFTMNQRLARTVNIGNALEAPHEGEWGVTLQADFFKLISQKGFTAVRLPIRWSSHALTEPPFTIDPDFFKRVDWAVEQALANDLVIIVNMHHYEEMALDANGHQERYVAMWKQIAEHYQSYPNTLLFELLNEPNGALTPNQWNNFFALALDEIRPSNPTRNIVIGPGNWNNINRLEELTLPADDQHIIVTFHFYDPFQFTHQGAEWVQGSESWMGTEWKGSSAEKQVLQFNLNKAEQWGKDNQRPIFMGEFGAYSKADMESRIRWTAFMAREAEARNISWGYWEFCSGFGLYDLATGEWHEELVQALIPPP